MRFRDLDELVALGQLEQKPPDPPRVRRWLDRSRPDLNGDAPPASESQLDQLIDDVGELLARLSGFLDGVKS